MTDQERFVTSGVDTHKAIHMAAVVDEVGRILGSESFPAGPTGYRCLLSWMSGFGVLARIGVRAPALTAPDSLTTSVMPVSTSSR